MEYSIIWLIILLVCLGIFMIGYPLIPLIITNEYIVTTNEGTTVCNKQLDSVQSNQKILYFAGTMNLLITIAFVYFTYYFFIRQKDDRLKAIASLVLAIYMGCIAVACFAKGSEKNNFN